MMRRLPYPTLLTVFAAFVFSLTGLNANDNSHSNWHQFRGEGARGIGTGDSLPEHWSANQNIAWKVDLPGRGWSSPVVWGNKVFVNTVINSGESEDPKKGLYFGGNRLDIPQTIHT